LQPEQLGFKCESLQDLTVDGVDASLQLITAALAGDKTQRAQSAANMIALNAGAALYVAGLAGSTFDGVSIANEILDSGKGLQKMQQLADLTQGF
jgi:anthranilate phosphoribosyltransferase